MLRFARKKSFFKRRHAVAAAKVKAPRRGKFLKPYIGLCRIGEVAFGKDAKDGTGFRERVCEGRRCRKRRASIAHLDYKV